MPNLTISLTAEQAQKVSEAVGFLNRLERAATLEEVRAHYIKAMKTDVAEAERISHKLSFTPTTLDLE